MNILNFLKSGLNQVTNKFFTINKVDQTQKTKNNNNIIKEDKNTIEITSHKKISSKLDEIIIDKLEYVNFSSLTKPRLPRILSKNNNNSLKQKYKTLKLNTNNCKDIVNPIKEIKNQNYIKKSNTNKIFKKECFINFISAFEQTKFYHEKQVKKLCGKHCINNFLQYNAYSKNDLIEIGELITNKERSLRTTNISKTTHYNEEGNFSIEVLIYALENKGYILNYIPNKSNIKNLINKNGFIVNKNNHWFSIFKKENDYYNMNSLYSNPKIINKEITQYIQDIIQKGWTILEICKNEQTNQNINQHNIKRKNIFNNKMNYKNNKKIRYNNKTQKLQNPKIHITQNEIGNAISERNKIIISKIEKALYKNKNNKKANKLKIASVNIRSIAPKKEEVFQWMSKNKIDILNIQESWINNSEKIPKFTNYEVVSTTPNKKFATGLLTYIQKDIKFQHIKTYNLEKGIEGIVFKIIGKEETIKIGNFYIHPYAQTEDLSKFKENMNDMHRLDILTGDYNSHNKMWSNGKENRRGTFLSEYIKENDYKIINNKKEATRVKEPNRIAGTPDLCMIKKDKYNQINSWEIKRDLSSDHYPIIFEIKNRTSYKITHRHKHWQYEKCNKNNYKIELELSLKNIKMKEIKNQKDLDEFYEESINKIIKCALNNCPRTKRINNYRGNTWWNDRTWFVRMHL